MAPWATPTNVEEALADQDRKGPARPAAIGAAEGDVPRGIDRVPLAKPKEKPPPEDA